MGIPANHPAILEAMAKGLIEDGTPRRREEAGPTKRASKYGNRKVEADGKVFDSRREYRRWVELLVMQAAGIIRDLEHHPAPYPLTAVNRGTGERIQVSRYEPDFAYVVVETGKKIIEDAKGKRTREYMRSCKWLLAEYGIKIQEV